MARIGSLSYASVCLAGLIFASTGFAQAAWDRNAVYSARVVQLQAAIDAQPNDPQPLVDLAAFYLKPLAPRDVEAADGKVRRVMVPLKPEIRGSIKDVVAVGWVWRGDITLARPLLNKALQLNPRHPGANREMAMLQRMRTDLDRMRPHMDIALAANPMDLDMCRLYLDHRTAAARVLNDQAVDLRTSRITEEQRADGRYRVTRQPSQADYARATQLDAQAQDVRRDAVKPLRNLVGTLKNDPQRAATPAKESMYHLGSAIYYEWIGELEKSGGGAKAALEADPTNLDALDYLIDLLRGTRTKETLAIYKPILDRWLGDDSTPVIAAEKPLGIRR